MSLLIRIVDPGIEWLVVTAGVGCLLEVLSISTFSYQFYYIKIIPIFNFNCAPPVMLIVEKHF